MCGSPVNKPGWGDTAEPKPQQQQQQRQQQQQQQAHWFQYQALITRQLQQHQAPSH
jgi:hypothetical protein